MGVCRTYSAVLWCGVVCVWGGGVSSCAVSSHFGPTHTPFNRQGPNEGPTCPTAAPPPRGATRWRAAGNPPHNNDPQTLPPSSLGSPARGPGLFCGVVWCDVVWCAMVYCVGSGALSVNCRTTKAGSVHTLCTVGWVHTAGDDQNNHHCHHVCALIRARNPSIVRATFPLPPQAPLPPLSPAQAHPSPPPPPPRAHTAPIPQYPSPAPYPNRFGRKPCQLVVFWQ